MKTRVSSITNLVFALTFCLGLASCNKDDYFEKEYLDNPFQDEPTTNGPVDNGGHDGEIPGTEDGGTQGGVDSGVGGGTTGGTTGSSPSEPEGGDTGSSTGGSTGGTTGGTEGGSTGGTEGGSTGGTEGGSTGGTEGGSTGGTEGGSTGGTEGGSTGGTEGGSTGGTEGGSTGGTEGGSTGGTEGGSTGGTEGGSTGGSYGDCNQGHGNDEDGIDESNPTIGLDPRCKREKFKQTSSQSKKLDIVWVIDNSGSMSDEQEALGSNFNAFIKDFITRDIDFKMAITTTDTSSSSKKGLMVSGSVEKLNSTAAKQNPTQFMSDFRNMVKVGTRGSGYEKGLDAAEGFMNRYSSFIRKDAYLAVVILSDEEDQSPKSVKTYTDNLKALKNEDGLVKVYSIVDVNLTNNDRGVSTGFKRYADASKNTAGIVADIRDDFHRSLNDMGGSIINLLDSFALANDPVDGTLKVFVDGVQTQNFNFDAASRSIKFDAEHLPPVGAEITVTYVKQ